jgi:tRNA(adenine34) deaminase
VTLNR